MPRTQRFILTVGLLVACYCFSRDAIIYAQQPQLAVLQERVSQENSDVIRRLDDIDKWREHSEQEREINDKRMAELEELTESNTWLSRGIAAALFALVLKEVLLYRQRRPKGSN